MALYNDPWMRVSRIGETMAMSEYGSRSDSQATQDAFKQGRLSALREVQNKVGEIEAKVIAGLYVKSVVLNVVGTIIAKEEGK